MKTTWFQAAFVGLCMAAATGCTRSADVVVQQPAFPNAPSIPAPPLQPAVYVEALPGFGAMPVEVGALTFDQDGTNVATIAADGVVRMGATEVARFSGNEIRTPTRGGNRVLAVWQGNVLTFDGAREPDLLLDGNDDVIVGDIRIHFDDQGRAILKDPKEGRAVVVQAVGFTPRLRREAGMAVGFLFSILRHLPPARTGS